MLIHLKVRIILWVISALMPVVIGIGMLGFVMILVFSSSDEAAKSQQSLCSASWTGDTPSEASLSKEQLDVAAAIYAAATEAGVGTRGAVVGIATALQESDLGANASTRQPNADGDVGVFQQRGLLGWYADGTTVEENTAILNDISYAAKTFFQGHTVAASYPGGNPVGYHIPGLVNIAGWESMTVAEAAQKVQVSAYPDAYAKHEPLATTLVTSLSGGASGPVVCGPTGGDLGECPVFDAKIENRLTPDAIKVLRCGKKKWPQLTSFSVYREGDPRDHGQGKAIDLMIPDWKSAAGVALGTEIAEYYKAEATTYGVTYVIWNRKIWSVARNAEGWRPCNGSNCYNGDDPTAAHEDHVHVSVVGNAGTSASAAEGDGVGGPGISEAVLPVQAGKYRISARHNEPGRRWSSGFHTGLDFAAPQGTEIRSVADGTVEAMSGTGAYGNLTKVRVNANTVIYYAHQSSMRVSPGQKVTRGQVIGAVGATGNVTGAHLHLEVRVNGQHVDPEAWLTKRGAKP